MTGGMRGGGACVNPKRLLVTGASLKFCADPSGSNGGFMQIARMNVDVYNKGQGGRGAWIMVNAQNTKMRIRVY